MKMALYVTFANLLIVGTVNAIGASALLGQEYVRDSGPQFCSYDELVQLSLNKEMNPALEEKLRLLTTTPFVNNEAYFNGARPRLLEVPPLGRSLRVALWNIERGLELDDIELFLTDRDAFMAKVEK